MPRGGKRQGSGAKSNWKHGKTKTIRVPVSLADVILDIARKLDNGESVKSSGFSQSIDLSTVNIPTIRGKSFVFLEELMKLGYEIEPLSLAERVRDQSLNP